MIARKRGRVKQNSQEVFGNKVVIFYNGCSPLSHVLQVSITYWTSREISVFCEFFSGDYTNVPVRKGERHAHLQGFQ